MIKKLFVKEPKINCYTPYGILFSILPDSMNSWIFNNFIQIIYSEEWNMYAFAGHHLLISRCPALNYYVYPDYLVLKNSSFINYIKSTIDAGLYVLIWVDKFYLPMSNDFMINHNPHELFIYGYNSDLNEVLIADNLQYGKFIFTSCAFENIEEGHMNLKDEFDFRNIQVFKLNGKYDYEFDIEQVAFSLDCYLNSKRFYYINKGHDMLYGITILEKVVDDINSHILDLRTYHLIYEHLLIMNKRVKYLIEHNYISKNDIDINSFEELENDALKLRNFVLKCMLKGKMDNKAIIKKIDAIKGAESRYFEKLLLLIR